MKVTAGSTILSGNVLPDSLRLSVSSLCKQAGDKEGRGDAVSKILPEVEVGMSLREDGTMTTASPMAPRLKAVGRRPKVSHLTVVTLSWRLASPPLYFCSYVREYLTNEDNFDVYRRSPGDKDGSTAAPFSRTEMMSVNGSGLLTFDNISFSSTRTPD